MDIPIVDEVGVTLDLHHGKHSSTQTDVFHDKSELTSLWKLTSHTFDQCVSLMSNLHDKTDVW